MNDNLRIYVPHPRPQTLISAPAAAKNIHRGSTQHFEVYYDHSLGRRGSILADAILAACEKDYTTIQRYFNGITPPNLPFKIYLTPDNSGAGHYGCDGTELYIGANSAPGTHAPAFMCSLVVAEEVEVFEAAIGLGWDCGASNGEGLSRVLANDMYPGLEPANFVSAPVWLNEDPRPNFVDQTEPSDVEYVSIGCSVLFLNWLHFQLGYDWKEIILAGAPTLGALYTNLTGKADGWQVFAELMNAYFPEGQPVSLQSDNPFPLTRAHVRAAVANHRRQAATITLDDMTEVLTRGILRAVEAREPNGHAEQPDGPVRVPSYPRVRTGIWFEVAEEAMPGSSEPLAIAGQRQV